jgi:aryl-alcohol dehydrogenase-like predicted oxidoreductase
MERRRLGQLEVSAVGLGCGTMTPFYGEPDRAAGIATIRRAREIGVDLLDTADGYGRGRNEELVAEAVRGHRGDYVIASKFGNLGLLGDPRFADGPSEGGLASLGRLCRRPTPRQHSSPMKKFIVGHFLLLRLHKNCLALFPHRRA